jgi:hypothetical protein
MTNDTTKVITGKPLNTGGVLVAPLGTAAPTNVTTALNAAFKPLGFIGEDGLTETTDRSTDKIKAWGGDVVKIVQSDYAATFTYTMIQATDADVLKEVYGTDNVTVTAATSTTGTLTVITAKSDMLPVKSYVFEIKDGLNRVRIYVPKGQITAIDEISYNDTDVVGYAVTLDTLKDETLGYYQKFIDDGVFSA